MAILNDKEIVVLHNIARKATFSQRELAKMTGISLGLVNVIVKKFIKTGVIETSHPNKKRMEYLLTSQGYMEAFRTTYRQAIDTIKNYKSIQSHLADLLKDLRTRGYNYFSIHGDGELKDLLESAFRKYLDELPVTLGRVHRNDPKAVVLNVDPDMSLQSFPGNVVNVLEKIGI